ncbi:hypothetical protein HNP52_001753 [Sphingomonas kyeonggiensis]|uniref:Uncharacterized protein n=1 Tax=Sphingomonas kyeonggiensis TaxID=1268553 RepID=A0A7W7NSI9_9SPHN|nr:hypothetical protein [Sphingomonas kyeonggiensis]MBB4838684.1 hypothetical protein [Sphingomonas kyeonggiensis]
MVFDLRGALLKKAEVESARLDDFEFRLRARTMRLLAPLLGVEPDQLVARIAVEPDEAILASLPGPARAWYDEARTEARRQLIAERGDPRPYKLA